MKIKKKYKKQSLRFKKLIDSFYDSEFKKSKLEDSYKTIIKYHSIYGGHNAK